MQTILLVEDELELARVIARELRAAGYGVEHVTDGETALHHFAEEPPDLVILDWMLPGIDGLEVLRRIRQSSPLPVLMLTARGQEIDRVIGLEVGADDYLPKPFGMRELLARVRALLRRVVYVEQLLHADRRPAGGLPDSASLAYGPLRLVPDAFVATLDDRPLTLTRTEFDLLCLLVRNPGRAFSRTYLLDTVWGEHYVTGDRSVDNAVLRLRRKLGAIGTAIETVWGVGYRLAREQEDRD